MGRHGSRIQPPLRRAATTVQTSSPWAAASWNAASTSGPCSLRRRPPRRRGRPQDRRQLLGAHRPGAGRSEATTQGHHLIGQGRMPGTQALREGSRLVLVEHRRAPVLPSLDGSLRHPDEIAHLPLRYAQRDLDERHEGGGVVGHDRRLFLSTCRSMQGRHAAMGFPSVDRCGGEVAVWPGRGRSEGMDVSPYRWGEGDKSGCNCRRMAGERPTHGRATVDVWGGRGRPMRGEVSLDACGSGDRCTRRCRRMHGDGGPIVEER
jgi:hypothetical protein